MKIFIINLPNSKERRTRISQQLSRFNIDYSFFKAIDGRKIQHPLFSLHQPKKFIFKSSSSLSKGELGCWASHYLLWKYCVQAKETIVVLEDDIMIDDNFPQALAAAEKLIDTYKYIRLSAIWNNKNQKIDNYENYNLIRYLKPPSGTQAYIVTPDIAQRFIDYSQVWEYAVDNFMDQYWIHKVECYALTPFSVHLTDMPSDIARSSPPSQTSLLHKIEKEYLRNVTKIHRFKHNISHRKKRIGIK